MLLKLIEMEYPLDYVIFYDTGMEFRAIYNNLAKTKKILLQYGIELIILKPERTFLYNMLERPINTRDGSEKIGRGWCGGLCRWGTAEKCEAIKRFYKTLRNEVIIEYIGIAADERQRINRQRNKNSIKLYPLIEWEMTEKDCLQYCYDKGWNWLENGVELYSVLDRVSCWCCKNKNKKELYNLWKYLPEYWEKLKDLQGRIEQPFKNYGSINDLEIIFQKGWQPK